MILWSLHTENTTLISRGIIFDLLAYDLFHHDTSTTRTHFVNFAAFMVSTRAVASIVDVLPHITFGVT